MQINANSIDDEMFRQDIAHLLNASYDKTGLAMCKHIYKKLLLKYHPDLHEHGRETYQEYTLSLTAIFTDIRKRAALSDKMQKYQAKSSHEISQSESYYKFAGRSGNIEKVSDRALYFLRLGIDKLLRARDYICSHTAADGYGDDAIYETCSQILAAYRCLRSARRLSGNPAIAAEARCMMEEAMKVHARIARQVTESSDKGLVVRKYSN